MLKEKGSKEEVMQKEDFFDKYQYVECHTFKHGPAYAREKEKFGIGGNAKVYRAYPVIKNQDGSYTVRKNSPFVIKILDRQSKFWESNLRDARREAEITAAYFKTEPVIVIENKGKKKAVIITEFHPGESPFSLDYRGCNNLSQAVSELDFHGRILLILCLLWSLAKIHKKHIHRDLKEDNILIEIAKIKPKAFQWEKEDEVPSDPLLKITNAIIDFGLAQPLDLSAEQKKRLNIAGSSLYFAPESFYGEFESRTDIYPMAAIAVVILGGDPFKEKNTILGGELFLNPFLPKDKPYVTEALFEDVENIPKFEFLDIQKIIEKFLLKMAAQKISERATTFEALLFFTRLNRLLNQHQFDVKDKAKTKKEEVSENNNSENETMQRIIAAQLILLANGLWDKENFKTFDWESEINFCKVVLDSERKGNLNAEKVKELLENTQQAQAKKTFNVQNDCKNLWNAIGTSTRLSEAASKDNMFVWKWQNAAAELLEYATGKKDKQAIAYIFRVGPTVEISEETKQKLQAMDIPTDPNTYVYQAYHGVLNVSNLPPKIIETDGEKLIKCAWEGKQVNTVRELEKAGELQKDVLQIEDSVFRQAYRKAQTKEEYLENFLFREIWNKRLESWNENNAQPLEPPGNSKQPPDKFKFKLKEQKKPVSAQTFAEVVDGLIQEKNRLEEKRKKLGPSDEKYVILTQRIKAIKEKLDFLQKIYATEQLTYSDLQTALFNLQCQSSMQAKRLSKRFGSWLFSGSCTFFHSKTRKNLQEVRGKIQPSFTR